MILYEMASGVHPFRQSNRFSKMNAIVQAQPAHPRSLNSAVSSGLAHVILKLLAKKPSDRFASAAEVAQILNQLLQNPQHPPIVSDNPFTQLDDEQARAETVVLEPVASQSVASPFATSKYLLPLGGLIALVLLGIVFPMLTSHSKLVSNTGISAVMPDITIPAPPWPSPKQGPTPPTSFASKPTQSLEQIAVDPLAVAFEEIHGAKAVEVLAWAKKLPMSFRPVAISARGGSREAYFDVIAAYDPGGAEWRLVEAHTEQDRARLWDKNCADGFQLTQFCPHEIVTLGLWVKEPYPWSANLSHVHDSTRRMMEARLGGDWPMNFTREGLNGVCCFRHGIGGSRMWNVMPNASPEELERSSSHLKTWNAKIERLTADASPEARQFVVVMAANNLHEKTLLEQRVPLNELPQRIAVGRANNLRLQAMASLQEADGIFYYLAWESDSRQLQFTPQGQTALMNLRKLGLNFTGYSNGKPFNLSASPNPVLFSQPLELHEVSSRDDRRFNSSSIQLLGQLPTVRHRLFLMNTQISDTGLGKLSRLPNLKHIESISLDRTLITDEGLEHLKNFPVLGDLNLRYLPITGAGFAHLKELKLYRLDLTGSPMIDNDAMEHLIEMTTLRELCLIGTRVTLQRRASSNWPA